MYTATNWELKYDNRYAANFDIYIGVVDVTTSQMNPKVNSSVSNQSLLAVLLEWTRLAVYTSSLKGLRAFSSFF